MQKDCKNNQSSLLFELYSMVNEVLHFKNIYKIKIAVKFDACFPWY